MSTTLLQKLVDITTSVASNIQQAFSVYNVTDYPTVKILKLAGDHLIHHCFRSSSFTVPQNRLPDKQKWNHMVAQYNLIETLVGFFKQFLSAIETLSGHLILLFNDILPPGPTANPSISMNVLDLPIPPAHLSQANMATMLLQKFVNITFSVANNIQQAISDYNINDYPTVKILKRAGDDLIHHWFQAASPHLNADFLQQKWNHMDAVENLSGQLICLFNDILPPETRNEQMRHWLYTGARYLIAALVLYIFVRLLFSCVVFVFRWSFMFPSLIIRLLFRCIFFIVKIGVYPFCTIFWYLKQLLWFGGKSGVKMMKAPGRPAMMIARAVFEANPKAYFSMLRGRR